MKKAVLTAFILFATAFLLLFSFQKDKKRNNSTGKKIYISESVAAPKYVRKSLVASSERTSGPEEGSLQAEAVQAEAKQIETMQPAVIQTNHSHSTEAEMNETLVAFFKEMPRTDLVQHISPHELHGTPQAVLAAGEKLAEIHEYFFNHPQPRDIEMSFYLKCSQQKDFFDSVRALCAARLSRHYFEATGHQISSGIFDENIDQLRREINL